MFRANVAFVSDPTYRGFSAAQIVDAVPAAFRHSFIFVADETAIRHAEHPLLVIDLGDEPGRNLPRRPLRNVGRREQSFDRQHGLPRGSPTTSRTTAYSVASSRACCEAAEQEPAMHQLLSSEDRRFCEDFGACRVSPDEFDHFIAIWSRSRLSGRLSFASNPILLDSKIMLTHYSAEVLFSPEARARFVEPNLESIPRHDD
jgi:hypothetical protein